MSRSVFQIPASRSAREPIGATAEARVDIVTLLHDHHQIVDAIVDVRHEVRELGQMLADLHVAGRLEAGIPDDDASYDLVDKQGGLC